jgi:hypothetical protein
VSYCNRVLDDAPAYFEEVIEVEELRDVASQLDVSLDAEIFEEAIETLEEFAASQEDPGCEDYDDDRYDDDRDFFASDDAAIDGMLIGCSRTDRPSIVHHLHHFHYLS